jgi:AbiU2
MSIMTQKTGEEAKSNYIEKMGKELGTQFYRLGEEFLWLCIKWGEYDALFGAGSERVDLLNRSAPTFFWMIKMVLWEDVLLHIARLTDPSESNGNKNRKNLTIQNLSTLVEQRQNRQASSYSQLKALIDAALEKTQFCRDWRNRHIAHRDLDLAINVEPARPLEPVDKKAVIEALIAIRSVLLNLEQRYMAADTVFLVVQPLHGVTDLLQVLFFGVKEQAKANERVANMEATEDDYPALYLRPEAEPQDIL